MREYKVVIIEDEIPAQRNLSRTIEREFDNLHIVAVLSSVSGAVAWFSNSENQADIIFMDVELSDGMCFDIFAKTKINGQIIITTAYDSYAVKAFRINCVDYLLKPVNSEDLEEAVKRCLNNLKQQITTLPPNIEMLREVIGAETQKYKRRFVIKVGDRISVVNVDEIAYIYAEDKSTYLVTTEGRKLILDMSLDSATEQINPQKFFRISRNATISIDSISGIAKHVSNRLKVSLTPQSDFEVFVSRSRTADFMNWLEDKNLN